LVTDVRSQDDGDFAGTAAQWIANASTALTDGDDLAGILAQLLDDCGAVTGADAVGVMVVLPDGSIEVLCASSHDVLELELYQNQVDSGPCLESIRSGQPIASADAASMARRWPAFATALAEAGYRSVFAVPMSWQRQVIGGLNIFRSEPLLLTRSERLMAHVFADLATVAVVNTGLVSSAQALERTTEALTIRNVIEQAKGFLAYRNGVDMATAYRLLRQLAADSDQTLGRAALGLMNEIIQR
jgi:GAF domain-containing protein